jgi:multimeric flavodoxin WrbA
MAGKITCFADFLCPAYYVRRIFASKTDAMQIIILNGNPEAENKGFDDQLAEYQHRLGNSGHIVRTLLLREMKLGFCRGCFKCWHTNPGVCNIDDDIKYVHKAVINADLVVWASPLSKGFCSSLLKKVQERMIPLLHPYVELVNGEVHHRKRYDHYPCFGMIVQKESDTCSEELQIVRQIQERYALNFRSRLNFFITTEMPVSEAVYETQQHIDGDAFPLPETEYTGKPALALYTSSLN